MNDTEFLTATDGIFRQIDEQVSDALPDCDVDMHGNVLEIHFENGQHLVLNRQAALQEIWLATPETGFHFSFYDDAWRSKKDGVELFSALEKAIQVCSGAPFSFSAQ